MADYLTIDDLNARITSQKVLQYLDDDLSGVIEAGDETDFLNSVLETAEGVVASKMLRAYPDAASITILANADAAVKTQAAWIACEILSERRPEFLSPEGWGPFRLQYERAIQYFEDLSKGKQRSVGEAVAGVGANTGGNLQPTQPTGTSKFTFAPDNKNPSGHGGF